MIHQGYFGFTDLKGLHVALAGYFKKNESLVDGARHPWHVILYVDELATPEQSSALADIFLGRAGGTPIENYAGAIGEVFAIKAARIELDHTPGKERLRVGESIWAATARAFPTAEPMTCGIPGHDRPGMELVATLMRVEDAPFHWAFSGRCGFSTDFEFRSAA